MMCSNLALTFPRSILHARCLTLTMSPRCLTLSAVCLAVSKTSYSVLFVLRNRFPELHLTLVTAFCDGAWGQKPPYQVSIHIYIAVVVPLALTLVPALTLTVALALALALILVLVLTLTLAL